MSATPATAGSPAVRSRRALLGAAVGGLAAAAAALVGRATPVQAAAGNPMILGQTNDSGTAQTTLQNAGLGAAFTLRTTNPASGAAGIFGWSSQTGTGQTRGVYGRADGPNSFAVHARQLAADPASGAAVMAEGGQNLAVVGDSSATTSIYGLNDNEFGTAVYGFAMSEAVNAQGTGVYGETLSEHGAGVWGRAWSSEGFSFGVYGRADGVDAVGVSGLNDAGVALRGESAEGYGLYAVASDTNSVNYGVYGETGSATGFGVYSDGNAHVAGTLSKSGGSFRIDHPLDPANRFLQHSFVESPDMKNVYDGVVTLGASGGAEIELPDWFEALNTDFRYQLTALGPTTRVLYVADGVRGNRFAIGGGEAGLRVSWQVTGIRKDPWASANRIEVELDKAGAARGRYLHPELYGKNRAERLHAAPAAGPRRPDRKRPA